MNRKKYHELCSMEPTIPIFSKYWWLDAVCGDSNWDVVLVERNGEIIASLPYYLKRNNGLPYITMPKLTQTMGPWIKYPQGQKYTSKLSYEKEVFTELIEKLPTFALFNQNFHYSITNWLPFYWTDFKQTTRYTYVIENLADINCIYANFRKQLRKEIRKAEKDISIISSDDLELFYSINMLTFERQGISIPYSADYVKALDNACRERKCRKIFFAIDNYKNVHSVLYLIWDENSAYDLMGGTNPLYKKANSKSLITWEAIKFASTVTKKFDFEGSMIEDVEFFIRGFGALQKPYFNISKVNSKILRVAKFITSIR